MGVVFCFCGSSASKEIGVIIREWLSFFGIYAYICKIGWRIKPAVSNLMRKFVLFMVVAMLSWSCNSPKTDSDNNTTVKCSVSAAPSTISVDANGAGNNSTVITCKGEDKWTLSGSGDGWCTPSATSGKSLDTVTFAVKPNESDDERTTSFVIACGTAQTTIKVVQKYKDALVVSTNRIEADYLGGQIEIEVTATDYTCSIEEGGEWMVHVSTRALRHATEVFKLDPNGKEPREGVIVFKSGSLTERVAIIQHADPNFNDSEADNEEITPGDPIE